MRDADSAAAPAVHCVIPVRNRLEVTRAFVEQMSSQDHPNWTLTIVDDGSTDGTSQWLCSLGDDRVRVLHGDGNLWWGGAMTLGMRFVYSIAAVDDYLLMLNDDVRIARDYVSLLVRASQEGHGAVVGSSQHFADGRSFAAAYHVDYLRMRLLPIDKLLPSVRFTALTGRGLLIPIRAARTAGFIHSGLPHYLGDLEYTARLRELGFELLVCSEAKVVTDDDPHDLSSRRQNSLRRRLGTKSPNNAWHRLVFFHSRGPWLLRLVAFPRYIMVLALRTLGALT